MAKYCANCGTNLPEGAQFCPECGQGLFEAANESEYRPSAQRPGGGSGLLIGLGVLVAVLAIGLIAALAYSTLTSGDTAGEAGPATQEPKPADFAESIVGQWSGTNYGETVSFEFVADGGMDLIQPDLTIVANYTFVDKDTIAVTSEEMTDQRFNISMPTEDDLTMTYLDEDGNPVEEEPLMLRRTADSTEETSKEMVQQQVGDFELQGEAVDPTGTGEEIFEAQAGERILLYKAPDGSEVTHILLDMPTPEDAERKRQEWLAWQGEEPNIEEFNTEEEPLTVNGRQVGTAVLFNIVARDGGDEDATGAVWTNGTLVAYVFGEGENGADFYESLSEY